MAAFAMDYGIKPWQWDRLTVAEVLHLVDRIDRAQGDD